MADVFANFGAGSIPEHYDSILGPAQFEAFAADLVQRLPALPPGDVLEVACGTGIVTRRMREKLEPDVRLVATDLSKPMLDYARQKLRGTGGIEWQEANAVSLPFDNASFGAVVCSFGVMFVPDKAKAFREARRVLRQGGLFLFNVWDGIENNPHGRTSNGVLASLFPGDPEMNFIAPFVFNDQSVIRSLLADAGFREIRFEKCKLEVRSPSAREFAKGAIRGTPRVQLLEQRGASVDDVVEKVAAAFERLGGDKPFRTTAQAIVVQARC